MVIVQRKVKNSVYFLRAVTTFYIYLIDFYSKTAQNKAHIVFRDNIIGEMHSREVWAVIMCMSRFIKKEGFV